jgi:hypothetical protein
MTTPRTSVSRRRRAVAPRAQQAALLPTEMLQTRVVLAQSGGVHLWIELEQDEERPEQLHLTVEGSCFSASATLARGRQGWSVEVVDAEAIRALGRTFLDLAERAKSLGMLDALRAANAAGVRGGAA